VTNITFIFETSPNTKPKEKKVRAHSILYPPPEKVGRTRPPCPLPNGAHDFMYTNSICLISRKFNARQDKVYCVVLVKTW